MEEDTPMYPNRWIPAAAFAALSLAAAEGLAQTVATTGTLDPTQLIWADPGSIASRDLLWGSGSPERAPKGPFAFVEERTSGTQPKIVVTDSKGVTWDVKFGREAHAEVAANRLVSVLGYFAEEIYFVPSGQVAGVPALERAGEHMDSAGRFSNARFSRRDPNVVVTKEEWRFDDNPFMGTKELSGLLILMTMINNWDIRGAANNGVLGVATPDGRQERRYLVSDLGATFGRMGGRISNRSKWNLEDYREEGFIEKVDGGMVHLDYDGFDSGLDRVPLDHARWFASLVAQLTPGQVRRAFEAAGAAPADVDGFATRVVEKITELKAAVR
jgi:hypothetical protein